MRILQNWLKKMVRAPQSLMMHSKSGRPNVKNEIKLDLKKG